VSGAGAEGGFRPGRWLLGRGWWALPLLLSIALSLPWIFGERWYSDAPYYQAIATQMAREGGSTWWSPMQGDLHYFNKPPLAFWIHAVLVKAFGDADWAAHLPEGAAFLGVCLLTAWLARRMHGSLVGMLAGCAMALTSDWFIRAGNFKLDSLHTFFLLAAMACWVRAFIPERDAPPPAREHRRGELGWAIAAGVCIGAALMTKPFYGAGAGVLAALWMWAAGVLNVRRFAMVSLSVLGGVLLAAPWHVSMAALHGKEFVRAYVHEQTVERALGNFHDREPWFWYLQLIAGTINEAIKPWRMWPIYALALAGLGVVGARWRDRRMRAGDALAAIWTLAWFVALSMFGGKRNYYLMVVHPGTAWLAAIAIGWGIEHLATVATRRAIERAMRGLAVVGAIAGVVMLARVPHLVAKGRRELPVPDRDEFMAFVRHQRSAGREVYDCGLSYRISSLTYIQTGYWPRCASERTSFTPDKVPAGGLAAYSAEMLAKGAFGMFVDPKDRLVFRSSPNGQYLVYERHAETAQPGTP
jgi:4-amino-4-deoxy-L-arabinose transferase-like glycosyltransferase